MKATGIVRRIDELGRIVIPKEIRKVLKIRESDPLEIYTGANGDIIFKKYNVIRSAEDSIDALESYINSEEDLDLAKRTALLEKASEMRSILTEVEESDSIM